MKMGRHFCCLKQKLRKGLWSPDEDEKLYNYVTKFGVGCWSSVPKLAGLHRCGKSCRLRWMNYLRPDLKRGMFSQQEEDLIISLHRLLGNRWAQIAVQLPGRTDNEIKNFWNSSLKKKLMKKGIDPSTHKPLNEIESEMNCGQDVSGLQTLTNLCSNQPTFLNNSNYHNGGLIEDSRDHMSYIGFEAGDYLTGYNTNLVYHLYQPTVNTTDENNFEALHSNIGFTSMPNLSTFYHGSLCGTEYSDNSASRMSSCFPNEVQESTSNSSNIMNNTSENATFSWYAENKVNSLFDFQEKGRKLEELKSSSWQELHTLAHNSVDFSSYSLKSESEDLRGANFDVFNQI